MAPDYNHNEHFLGFSHRDPPQGNTYCRIYKPLHQVKTDYIQGVDHWTYTPVITQSSNACLRRQTTWLGVSSQLGVCVTKELSY